MPDHGAYQNPDMKRSPVIILGMHRSGTSILTGLLSELGLFTGRDKVRGTQESLFFYRLNEWMLSCANATWDGPDNFRFVDEGLVDEFDRVLRRHLRGMGRWRFLGVKEALRYHDILDLDLRWGWKDPRNTWTAQVWQRVFPKSRYLHIYRNPVDVAESLRIGARRHIQSQTRTWRWTLNEHLLRRVPYQLSPRVANLREGVALWKEYVSRALWLQERYPDQTLNVRFETLLENPVTTLSAIADFASLPASHEAIGRIAEMIDSARRFAFLEKPSLRELYGEIRNEPLMKSLGYDALT